MRQSAKNRQAYREAEKKGGACFRQVQKEKNNHGKVEKRRQGLRIPDRMRDRQEVQKEQSQRRGEEKQDGDGDGQKIKGREEILCSRLRLREVQKHESVWGLEQGEGGQGEKITQTEIWGPRKNTRPPFKGKEDVMDAKKDQRNFN